MIMCTLGYPTEIQKLVDTFDPYREAISSKQFDRIPPEAVDAFNKFKQWSWEQDQ